jgi:hypothetical protein
MAEVPDTLFHRPPRVVFVEQRTARVRVVVGSTVFLMGTVPNISGTDEERGLLGIAVDPAWPTRPCIYAHYTDIRSGHHVAISRFTVTGDLTFTSTGALQFDPVSRYDLLMSLPDNAINHNGGTVRFGPDRALYVSLAEDSTFCPSQDITFLGGKILRLDVSRLPVTGTGPPPFALLIPPGNPFVAQPDSGAMLVWTYGLRNPFRFSIDSKTGVLYVADVGWNAWEEVDRVATGGMNMGWPRFEGPAALMACSQTSPNPPVGPIYSYDHGQGNVIIDGGLYRRPVNGSATFPAEYDGDYFFLDYGFGFLRRLKGSGTSWTLAAPVPGQPLTNDWGLGFDYVSDVVEMSDGSLWYCRQMINGASLTGELRRIAYASSLAAPMAGTAELELQTPRPSPSVGSATLRWSQPQRDRVRLVVHDLNGRSIRTLQDGVVQDAGAHEAVWDGRDETGALGRPGIYFARLQVGKEMRQVRITLLHDAYFFGLTFWIDAATASVYEMVTRSPTLTWPSRAGSRGVTVNSEPSRPLSDATPFPLSSAVILAL